MSKDKNISKKDNSLNKRTMFSIHTNAVVLVILLGLVFGTVILNVISMYPNMAIDDGFDSFKTSNLVESDLGENLVKYDVDEINYIGNIIFEGRNIDELNKAIDLVSTTTTLVRSIISVVGDVFDYIRNLYEIVVNWWNSISLTTWKKVEDYGVRGLDWALNDWLKDKIGGWFGR